MKTKHRIFTQLTIGVAASLLIATANAACLTDQPEIGDVGPDANLVCASLESISGSSDIKIVDRQIHSPERVSVRVERAGRQFILDYQLVGIEWQQTDETSLVLGQQAQ